MSGWKLDAESQVMRRQALLATEKFKERQKILEEVHAAELKKPPTVATDSREVTATQSRYMRPTASNGSPTS